MDMLDMQEGIKYEVLRKENFLHFIEITKGNRYDIGLISLKGLTHEELDPIKNRVTRIIGDKIKKIYGFSLPLSPHDYAGIKGLRFADIDLSSPDANFKKLKAAHESKKIKKFILKKDTIIKKPGYLSVYVPGIKLAGAPLANGPFLSLMNCFHLYDKSKPQDYLMKVEEPHLKLEPKIRKLFQEIPQPVLTTA